MTDPRPRDEDFADFMRARWADLVRTLVSLGCDLHEAEDVAQTALARCLRSWERVRAADDIDAYVYRTLLNCWNTSRRRRWWSEQPTERLPEGPSAGRHDPGLDSALDRASLIGVLSRLSIDHRTVLVLRFGADLSEAQTADVLGVAAGTVKSRVSRALAAIDHRDLSEEPS
ncbi:MAG TPA: SigE family RNA polymerase sigma factor [Nocardioides sp.]|uniref:SigE family RNA polymerase sigma factor n=1 Tax=Nocardioides sp. TaxID=35761 RepID=UPI002C7EE9D8|nr:SigE family RNA polymerase sigma factor [Nocardioides sp.]HTW14940.1 SigE family RNA polymerase sigma factor [Nocardioides sp.]